MRESALKKTGDFPEWKTMITATDFMYELNRILDVQVYDRSKVESYFGVNILMDSDLPIGTAILLDKDLKIVAVIQDQKVVEIK